MKTLILFLFLLPTLMWGQYHPMTIHGNLPTFQYPNDTCTIHVTPAQCTNDACLIGGYIQGGTRPYFYKWRYVSNNTIVQDSTPSTIVPGYDYPAPFDNLDHFDVTLNTPQVRLFAYLNWTGQWELTVIDSRVESATDKHDTLKVNITHKWPETPIINIDACDTCVDDYLWITPQRGTPPYNITVSRIIDDFGGSVEQYYTENSMSLNITNLAQLPPACYRISVADVYGCYAETTYCYGVTTGIDDLQLNKELVKIVDLMGRPTEPTPNKILIYCYSDGTIIKQLKSE
jgi:hypothetical protein